LTLLLATVSTASLLRVGLTLARDHGFLTYYPLGRRQWSSMGHQEGGSLVAGDFIKATPFPLYLFIQRAASHNLLAHPLDHPSHSCPVLQYADDTLILIRGDLQAVIAPKHILEQFSLATGLHINFHKSTFVPIHLPEDTACAMASVLGCPCCKVKCGDK
jgi:hypothetical protein